MRQNRFELDQIQWLDFEHSSVSRVIFPEDNRLKSKIRVIQCQVEGSKVFFFCINLECTTDFPYAPETSVQGLHMTYHILRPIIQ